MCKKTYSAKYFSRLTSIVNRSNYYSQFNTFALYTVKIETKTLLLIT